MMSREHAFVGCCLLLALAIPHPFHFRYLCRDALVIGRDLRSTQEVRQRCVVLLQPENPVSTCPYVVFLQDLILQRIVASSG